jgi:Patched family
LTVSDGDGNERALKTLQQIGAAVWQGGGSTMLAVSLLAFSDAYTYQTFFKVFTIVVIFALFYGTFLLPVILSIFAPKPYDIRRKLDMHKDETELCVYQRSVESFNGNDRKKPSCDNGELEKFNDMK